MKRPFLTWTFLILLGALTVGLLLKEPGKLSPSVQTSSGSGPGEDIERQDLGVHVYGTAWGMTLAEDGTGFYNELMALFLDGLTEPVRYDVRPYRRAKALFYRNSHSCLYPSNIDLLVDGGEIPSGAGYLDTNGLLHVKVYIFSQPGSTPPSSLSEVGQQSVAYAMGSRIPYFLQDVNADFIAVANEGDKARMLLSGRVDLMTAAMPDAKFVFDSMQQPLPPFDPTLELNDTLVRITCHDTPQNRAFIAAFNKQAVSSIKTQKAKELMRAHRLDPDLYLPQPTP